MPEKGYRKRYFSHEYKAYVVDKVIKKELDWRGVYDDEGRQIDPWLIERWIALYRPEALKDFKSFSIGVQTYLKEHAEGVPKPHGVPDEVKKRVVLEKKHLMLPVNDTPPPMSVTAPGPRETRQQKTQLDELTAMVKRVIQENMKLQSEVKELKSRTSQTASKKVKQPS